jgi:hypothetical protein
MSFRKKSVKKQELLNLQGDMIMFTSQNSISVIAVLIILGISLNCLAEEQAVPTAPESLKRACFTEYTSSKLDEMSNSLKTIATGSIETGDEDESMHELIRILKTTHSKYQALNHYIFGWNTTMEYQYRANVEAVKRGVEVSRTFIISDDTFMSSEKLNNLLEILATQKKDGIKVFYGLQRELKNEPGYHKYTLLDAGLSDDAVFATVTAFSIKGPQPAHVKIIWDKNTIKEQNPFPFLEKSPHIKPFDENSKKALVGMLKK